MGFFKPTVTKILITLFFFFYLMVIGFLQIIPPIAEWRNTLIYPFTQLANFLVSLAGDNGILAIAYLFLGQIIMYYCLACCLTSIFTFLKQETPKKQRPRR